MRGPTVRAAIARKCWGIATVLASAVLAVSPGAADGQPYRVEPAPEWDALFDRDSGWTGADGIYSIPLNGVDSLGSVGPTDETLWTFGDTAIGDVAPDGHRRRNTRLVNNTLALLVGGEPDEEQMDFYWRGQTPQTRQAMFLPTTPDADPDDWYWPMDGFVHDGLLQLCMLRVRKDGLFFALDGVALVTMDLEDPDPYGTHTQIDTPLYREATETRGTIHLGQAVVVNTVEAGAAEPDGYIYVYGQESGFPFHSMLVARVPAAQFADFSSWEYWDGTAWSPSLEEIAPITDRISTEFSITRLDDGRYLAVFQANALGAEVAIRVGESLVGPFGEMRRIYRCPEVDLDPDNYVYNAKAHPHLSKPGELLISYNVNTFDFFGDFFLDADIFRPRFIRLIAEEPPP